MSENLASLELQQLSIVIATKNHNPAKISPDFLLASEIIPHDWQLRTKPTATSKLVQLEFKNGVNLTAQVGRIIFGQAITQSSEQEILAPIIAHTYAKKLPAADYQYLQISLGNIFSLGGNQDNVRQLIVETLLSHAPWHSFGKSPVKASIDLLYELENCQLNLKVDEARLQKSSTNTIPALTFAGNFTYSLDGCKEQDKISHLCQLINNWHQDLAIFQEIVRDNILQNAISALPKDLALGIYSEQKSTEKIELVNS